MPLCGFNKKMIEGLKKFNEGLVEHGLIHRSQKNEESIEQAINRELSDMMRFLEETQEIDKSSKRIITEGLVKYSMGFYLIMRENNIEDYEEILDLISDYFRFMDSKYYSELEGQPDDMKKLVELLNDKNISSLEKKLESV